MVTFTSIPAHMDKQMFIKSLSKEYRMPLDMIWCLIRDMDDEEKFFSMLDWNKTKNGFGWKKQEVVMMWEYYFIWFKEEGPFEKFLS